MDKKIQNTAGFTLVELMITLAFSGLIVIIISVTYTSQQRSYLAQEQVAEMQENIRAAIDLMASELKMAGYDPTDSVVAGIDAASPDRINFTRDITNTDGTSSDGDGKLDGPNENIIFGFSDANDADFDGLADAGSADLGRNTGGGYQPIAEHIQAIEFFYTDADGNQTATIADIRAVQITILARAGQADQNFLNTFVYCPASNPFDPATQLCTNPDPALATSWGPYNDHFRRRQLITTVQLRNMGI